MPFAARLAVFALASTLASHAQTATPLATQITSLLAEPTASRAHWGIAVTELDGTPIYGLDESKLFRPASNAKLFTTAAAMAILGPGSTVTTTVEGEMNPDGVVQGDLRLVGAGDANFGGSDLPYIAPKLRSKEPALPPSLRDLDDLVTQLKHAGLKQVVGNIVGDDSYFPAEPVGSWDVGDLVWGYGALPSALSIADNQLTLSIAPVKPDSSTNRTPYPGVKVTLEQYDLPFYTVESQVTVSEKGSGTHIDVERTGPQAIRVFGTIAADAPPDTEHISIDDPALFAAMALRARLISSGILVGGSPQPFHFHSTLTFEASRPLNGCEKMALSMSGGSMCAASCLSRVQGRVLAAHTSPPVVQDVSYTMKVSQNLHAELLSQRIGSHSLCPHATSANGSRLLKAFLEEKAAIDPADLVLNDGSGLSGHDLITPRAATQLLAYATKQPWFPQWKAALPVGGEDGSLASRFADAPLKGHVFAKTGTLGESRALSGYLDCASGKQVIFSILVDDHAPSGSNDRDVMDRIVAAIAATN